MSSEPNEQAPKEATNSPQNGGKNINTLNSNSFLKLIPLLFVGLLVCGGILVLVLFKDKIFNPNSQPQTKSEYTLTIPFKKGITGDININLFLYGKVTNKSDGTITLEDKNSKTQVVPITSSTVFKNEEKTEITLKELAVGDYVNVLTILRLNPNNAPITTALPQKDEAGLIPVTKSPFESSSSATTVKEVMTDTFTVSKTPSIEITTYNFNSQKDSMSASYAVSSANDSYSVALSYNCVTAISVDERLKGTINAHDPSIKIVEILGKDNNIQLQYNENTTVYEGLGVSTKKADSGALVKDKNAIFYFLEAVDLTTKEYSFSVTGKNAQTIYVF